MRATLTIFVVTQALLSEAQEYNDYPYPEGVPKPPKNICNLPENLGYSGLGKPIVDCDTLDYFKEPPCNIYSWGGNHPMICCPIKEDVESLKDDSIEYQGDNNNIEYEGPDDYSYYYDYEYVYECNTGNYPRVCPVDSSCVASSKCGDADFNKTMPPMTCGFDNGGEDKFCCSDTSFFPAPQTPQPPKFLSYNKRKYSCEDHAPKCRDWVKSHPDSCYPGHESYPFMRSACQKSCERCGSEGCVDDYEKCAEWSRAGVCSERPEFMSFHCRESCGTCGFKSSSNSMDQVVNGKQYTTDNHKAFTCGENKRKDKLKNDSENKPDTTMPHGPVCTSVIISDRFLITAAHCLEGELGPGAIRKITIRDDTAFTETIEVKRFWQFPKFDGSSYYDIAVIELERRILYDWETYGDSPTCLAKDYNIQGTKGLAQGYGLTENGIFPDSLLEANVTILTNERCRRKLQWKIKNTNLRDSDKEILEKSLPDGLNKHLLCTQGIYDYKTNVHTGPCKGDDGGPLYINGKANSEGDIEGQTLAAINSGAAGKCGKGEYPAWWTRISSYYQWIMCIQKNAQNGLSHALVQRKCESYVPKVYEEQLPLKF